MKAKTLITGFAVLLAIFAAGLYYAINYAHYETQNFDTLTLENSEGKAITLRDVAEIDAPTSPIKMRRCAVLEGSVTDAQNALAPYANPTPLIAPNWFDCFDAEELSNGIDERAFTALAFDENVPYGIDTILLVDPQTNASFMWRQINECGEARYSSDPLPADCPPFEE